MTEEEFEQIQAALVASMGQNEDIVIGDDDDDEGNGEQAPGYLNQIMGMFGGGLNQQNQDAEEDDKNY